MIVDILIYYNRIDFSIEIMYFEITIKAILYIYIELLEISFKIQLWI